MGHHYLLWATGADRPGIVAAVARVLYENKCNIEDSSMQQLGAEFGILLIFSSENSMTSNRSKSLFKSVAKKFSLAINVKAIQHRLAKDSIEQSKLLLVTLHGADRPGLVYTLTATLAKHRFNITDLMTHRTPGKKPGYVLFVEGEFRGHRARLEKELSALARRLATRIQLRSITPAAI
jgi:glycine cleavage system transcriptional repressor